MSKILDNIYIWAFSINSEIVLLLTLQNCIFCTFWRLNILVFLTKNCWKSSYICVFILSKKRHNWFHKNLHNSGMVGSRKLFDPLMNHILNALSIGVQYMLSFQLNNFCLKCLLKCFSYRRVGMLDPTWCNNSRRVY